MLDLFKFELEAQQKGAIYIAGVDEVGRGPLAGDLVVAAVIPDLSNPIKGVNDSKKLTPKKREQLCAEILRTAIAVSIVHKTPARIDEINILNATKEAMKEALEGLTVTPDIALIDAVKIDTDIPLKAIIGGDGLSYAIACASIVAKVTRDAELVELDRLYPEYGFAQHKGYGTPQHIRALQTYGALAVHRKSFIKKFVNTTEESENA